MSSLSASKKILVIGGGAAGFFFAVNAAIRHPGYQITILEKSTKLLEKVRISGGGRCNVTHACYDPKLLVKRYPRGERELLGAFHRFMTHDTVAWFEQQGVAIKEEADGRMFPTTNDSETIAQCLLSLAAEHRVNILTHQEVDTMNYEGQKWHLTTATGEGYAADIVFVASGSSLRMWEVLRHQGYEVAAPVPSLFTFNIKDERIKDLQGIAAENVTVMINDTKLQETGPLLITHWGVSGPAILKLSAWGAVILHQRGYKFDITINWSGGKTLSETITFLKELRLSVSKKNVYSQPLFKLSSRLWDRLCAAAGISPLLNWADLSNKEVEALALSLSQSRFTVTGKSTFKDEFVTCGGVELHQINLKTFESKLHPRLYFGGEVLNIDAITGGYNFQAAWTGAWTAANAIS